MSKLYQKYEVLKKQDTQKYYLFKSGLFYIFIGDDAIKAGGLLGLKCTKLTDEIYKCGFPVNSLDKYMNRIHLANMNVMIIDNNEQISYNPDYLGNVQLLECIRKIKKLNLDELTPLESLKVLHDLKGMLENE